MKLTQPLLGAGFPYLHCRLPYVFLAWCECTGTDLPSYKTTTKLKWIVRPEVLMWDSSTFAFILSNESCLQICWLIWPRLPRILATCEGSSSYYIPSHITSHLKDISSFPLACLYEHACRPVLVLPREQCVGLTRLQCCQLNYVTEVASNSK